MKTKHMILAVMTGLISLTSQAKVSENFGAPAGWMDVFNLDSGTKGSWLWGSSWTVSDLQALTADNITFELRPNINAYDESDPYWSDGAGGGNKWMGANCYREANPIGAGKTNVLFTFSVVTNDLHTNYTCEGFIKLLDPGSGWITLSRDAVTITNAGTYTIEKQLQHGDANYAVQAGWTMNGPNANPATNWGSVTVSITDLIIQDNDSEPPLPDPMTWAVDPAGNSSVSVSMVASTATDSNGVEYLFQNITLGHDSGWLGTNAWTDTGLNPLTSYDYQVKARDKSSQNNETGWSGIKTGTTLSSDTNPPTPDPMTFSGSEASPVTVKLTATTATDDQTAVEYYFTCVSGAGNDSGWQSNPVYVDTGLSPGSNYTYTVTARDLNSNATAASSNLVVTTLALPGSYSLTNSLQGFSGNNTQGTLVHELAMAGFEPTSNDAGKIISFDVTGATFGDTATWENRNVLRTIAQDYGDDNFEVYATFITSNTTEQTGFIGVGPGLIGGWGVPDFELAGVNATMGEVQGNWCKVFTYTNGIQEQITEEAGLSSNTNRVRMVHDATAKTITIEVDEDYNGSFFSDRIIGTHSTSNLWIDMPQRIYIAGGAGVHWKDLQITSSTAPVIAVNDLSMSKASGGGMLLTWSSEAGQTYDVLYKTDLSASWTTDPSPGASGISGTGSSISVTSTVSAAEAFYTVTAQ